MNNSRQYSQNNFYDRVRRVNLTRRSDGPWGGGVCAGVADRLGFPRAVVRIAAVVLALCGGLGVLLYGLAWLILPEPTGRIHLQDLFAGNFTAGVVAGLVLTVIGVFSPGFWTGIGAAIVAALGVWLLVASSRAAAGPGAGNPGDSTGREA